MKVSLDSIDFASLIRVLLPYNWQWECEIVNDGCGPVVVRWGEDEEYLRYSAGPRQGYFWDVYGDDMRNTSLALLALSQAPPPPGWKRPVYQLVYGYTEKEVWVS